MEEIMKMIAHMNDELHGAKDYAKKCVKTKSSDPTMAKRYQEMANDELKHAMYIYENTAKHIEDMGKTMPAYQELLTSLWDNSQNKYVECSAKVKYILNM